ncbi:hypothetical protein YS65_000395 [Salmonella enterica subsp. enterica]|nr:hypothetical protein [Salmonella enterica]EBS2904829.1 hypothetical protein [Salmonella enterica subsp. enterica serovar Flottbek]EDP8831128.1 hypothetical protein [Salmonella enterica subsp. enterica]EEE4100490.1 hypothetical protein [Salmonella enterica subsp. enterica serovar Enteritidis]HCM6247068.1 hypothetical protein [Salmonella enterica subsp. enterica serovar 45:b:-]
MFMLLLNGNRLNPETFIHVRQIYGSTVTRGDEPIPVKQTYMTMICDGDAVPVRNVYGSVICDGDAVPVRSIYGVMMISSEV